MDKIKLGELLIREGFITEEQFKDALERQKVTKHKFETVLIENQYISENDLLKILAKEIGYVFSDNPISLYDESVSRLITREIAHAKKVAPLYVKQDVLYLLIANPFDFVTLEDIKMITGHDTVPVVSSRTAVEQTINRIYPINDIRGGQGNLISEEDAALMDRVDSAPIVKLVNSLIEGAYNSNASDIHIEPYERQTVIRYRIDGMLREHMILKKEIHELISTRIKIISGLNIAEKRTPQDGSFRLISGNIKVDLRVSTIPTSFGEKVVLRLLGANQKITYHLEDLDIAQEHKDKLRKIMNVPNGIILITGPTGSGKTTTLYSALDELATPEMSVVTVEDPIEKQFDGITQVQINSKAGLTFASGLRSILRQDPDIIMVGEIRDGETADIAIRAAITGHLVLSTLHTNDALSSVVRLIDMGVAPFLVASSVKGVVAQRLVRRVCQRCAETVPTTSDDRILMGDPNLFSQRKGKGCEYCENSGYSGRLAVLEIIPINQHFQDLITSHASMDTMISYAKEHGISLLQDDVLRLIKEGRTTVEEARRILFSVE